MQRVRSVTDILFTGVRAMSALRIASLIVVMIQFDCFRHGPAENLPPFAQRFARVPSRSQAQMRRRKIEGAHHSGAPKHVRFWINVLWYLGFCAGHSPISMPPRVTQIGRDLLKKMIDWLNAQGAQVIEVDTDGIYFVPPEKIDIDNLQKDLAKELPPGIEVEVDEQFDAMFSYKAKNYALLTRDGDVIIKGGALKSRGLEKFSGLPGGNDQAPHAGKTARDPAVAGGFRQKIRNRGWNIEMLMKTMTPLQDSLDKYRQNCGSRETRSRLRTRLASGRNYKRAKNKLYVKARRRKSSATKTQNSHRSSTPQNRDENVDY